METKYKSSIILILIINLNFGQVLFKFVLKLKETLTPAVINGGHFDLVEDISWEPEQKYFISVSKDQTCRFHGNWIQANTQLTWHELGRPQIHGYDLVCVSFLDRFKFVSGGDEKLLRIFQSPRVFLNNYYRLSSDQNVKSLLEVF